MKEPHVIIGIVLWVLVMIQPVLGLIHHSYYKKHQRRGLHSHFHIWFGRTLITVGIINGGLGFLLADYSGPGVIAYGVLAGIVWAIYILTLMIVRKKRSRSPKTDSAAQPISTQGQRQAH
jgi:hypothetical protein